MKFLLNLAFLDAVGLTPVEIGLSAPIFMLNGSSHFHNSLLFLSFGVAGTFITKFLMVNVTEENPFCEVPKSTLTTFKTVLGLVILLFITLWVVGNFFLVMLWLNRITDGGTNLIKGVNYVREHLPFFIVVCSLFLNGATSKSKKFIFFCFFFSIFLFCLGSAL